MQQYLEFLETIKEKGTWKSSARKNMPRTISLFGHQFRHSLKDGFPLLTTKDTNFKNIVLELLWILKGDSNIQSMVKGGCNIWNEDAYAYYCKRMEEVNNKPASFTEWEGALKKEVNGDMKVDESINLPHMYKIGDTGVQYPSLWRDWKTQEDITIINTDILPKGIELDYDVINKYINDKIMFPFTEIKYFENSIDQLKELIKGLIESPMSRRHVLTSWNPATLDKMALNACHALVQFNCRPIKSKGNSTPKYYLDCQMYQRSADAFLGVPYNIASYSLLTEILAEACNMVAGDFIHTFGDAHIYENHLDQVNVQLSRETRPLPKLVMSENAKKQLSKLKDDISVLQNLTWDDFKVVDYNPHKRIKGKLSTGINKNIHK